MLEQEWANFTAVLEKQIRLFEENKALMEEKIKRLETDMSLLNSAEEVNELRDQMHHFRRQTDEVGTKLKDAESHIEKQKTQIKNQAMTIDDLTRRCKELEDAAAAADNSR